MLTNTDFILILFLIEIHASKQRSAASDLGLHCLPLSQRMGRYANMG